MIDFFHVKSAVDILSKSLISLAQTQCWFLKIDYQGEILRFSGVWGEVGSTLHLRIILWAELGGSSGFGTMGRFSSGHQRVFCCQLVFTLYRICVVCVCVYATCTEQTQQSLQVIPKH